jgi:hypothetical protein
MSALLVVAGVVAVADEPNPTQSPVDPYPHPVKEDCRDI